jgi:hypothetical protein
MGAAVSPFEAYRTYLALKQHFTKPGYDFFKYNGKVNVQQSTFEVRKDKYQFYKLSKHKDPLNYLVCNFVYNDVKWIGDLFSDPYKDTYTNWLKYQQSITYNFTNEINKLLTNFNENYIVTNGQHPHLLKLHRTGEISLETMIILDDILGFSKHWNKEIEDTILWPSIYQKMVKYKPFISYDKNKCRKVLKSSKIWDI